MVQIMKPVLNIHMYQFRSHLPYMYIGVQYMEQGNMVDSFKYLTKSMERCDSDPVLYIEFGVYHYNVEE